MRKAQKRAQSGEVGYAENCKDGGSRLFNPSSSGLTRGSDVGASCARGLEAAPETPWIDPRAALRKAVRRAAWLVSQGQAAEASALLRAAEALDRLNWAAA